MPIISITVADKIAQVQGSPVIVCGNSDYAVQFTFDSEWDAYEQKTAEFRYWRGGERKKAEVLFSGSSVSVPVLRDIDEVEIGLCAGDLHTSTPARIPCARSITDGDAVHDPPAPDVYAQLMEYLASLQNGGANVAVAKLRLVGTAETVIGVAEEIALGTADLTEYDLKIVTSMSDSTGTWTASSATIGTRMGSDDYVPIPAGASAMRCSATNDSNELRWFAYLYDANKNFIALNNDWTAYGATVGITAANPAYARFGLSRSSGNMDLTADTSAVVTFY